MTNITDKCIHTRPQQKSIKISFLLPHCIIRSVAQETNTRCTFHLPKPNFLPCVFLEWLWNKSDSLLPQSQRMWASTAKFASSGSGGHATCQLLIECLALPLSLDPGGSHEPVSLMGVNLKHIQGWGPLLTFYWAFSVDPMSLWNGMSSANTGGSHQTWTQQAAEFVTP
jgi:hypothetical protein